MPQLRLGIAQTNVVVGDLEGNAVLLAEGIAQARAAGCALVAFPELALTGYPPEDLLLKPRFVERNLEVLAELAAQVHGIVAVIGFVDRVGDALANAAAVCADGAVVSVYRKRRLPNYAVFDEQRYFVPGDEPLALVDVAGVRVGVTICEDAWWPGGPMRDLAAGGAELLINVNASPYHRGKVAQREAMLAERAAEVACPIAYVNLVGGQDELVFDGASLVIGGDGVVQVRAPQYEDGLIVADIDVPARPAPADALPVVAALGHAPPPVGAATPSAVLVDDAAEVYGALVLGLRDYVRKNGFAEVVIGLSGGIDSSLVACVAVDALGAEHVHGVLMPSRFSSDHSVVDAEDLAVHLGIDHRTIAIEPAHHAFLELLAPSSVGREPGLAEENLQARIRGTLLMALSNMFGWMVITTSNKSESAVGYSTLYGDSAGGFAVIKDVPKTLVFSLAAWVNERAGQARIPTNVLSKPPSAELRPDQRDDQSLPPYDELDPILAAYVEEDRTAADLIEAGFDAALVRRITQLVDVNEYKRRQFPPGVRITTKAFGKDRRLPITNRFRG